MPKPELKGTKCKDISILRIAKDPMTDDYSTRWDHSRKCTDFKIDLFEHVTGLRFADFALMYPLLVFECMEEELEYEHDVFWASRETEFELFIPVKNQNLVNWIEKYCFDKKLTFRRMKKANLHMFHYIHKPWMRDKAKEFREKHST